MANKIKNLARRKIIKAATVGVSGLAISGLNEFGQVLNFAYADSHQTDPSNRPFNLPALDTGTRRGADVKFDLKLIQDETHFFGSTPTPTLGVNGSYLGPVLRVKKGDRVQFSVNNRLDQDATIHWHGLMLPAKMDGGPHQVIRPGETWHPEFKIIQGAASYWYHAHTHQLTGYQVYHGLAGMFIVDDEVSESLDLPKEYGVDDIPVVIQDRIFNRDGSFRYLSSMHDRMRGMLGDTILVNGVITPTLKAKKPQLRLRLLNGSNARIYDLGFRDSRSFTLIAGDGGFLEHPKQVDFVRIAPGERAEILIDLSDGRDAILYNQPRMGTNASGGMGMMMGGGNERFSIMRITAPEKLEARMINLPATLISPPDWLNEEPKFTRKMQLDMLMGPRMMMGRAMGQAPFSINGRALDIDVINFSAKKNSYEVWEITNDSALAHPFHIHNTQFQILARSGRSVSSHESGLKDTVLVYPGERVRLLVPFPEYADPQRPYMYHCHILEHEDGGMMGQFTVES